MAVRSTMSSLIARVRIMINDPSGINQTFADQDIQDIMDESRMDYSNEPLTPYPTFSGSSIQYLDYYHDLGGWEDGVELRQYLTVLVTPSQSEPIAGHWAFATSVFPPLYITGSVHDVFRAAADLLERWAAQWVLKYSVTVDGQGLQRSQVAPALLNLAHSYRLKQRPSVMSMISGNVSAGGSQNVGLGPTDLDFFASG